jgi:hypothetical protein
VELRKLQLVYVNGMAFDLTFLDPHIRLES